VRSGVFAQGQLDQRLPVCGHAARDGPVQQLQLLLTCFNEEQYLAEAIESALAQTHSAVEVIVINDGSTDRSAEVAASFGDRVQIFAKVNGGLSSARNRGIDAARGTYMTFLDADDCLRPNFVERTLEVFEAHPELAFVYTQMELFGREESISKAPEFSVERLVWTGKVPFEIQEMQARPDGFELLFTQAVDVKSASDVTAYSLASYTYLYQAAYGSDEIQRQPLVIRAATVSPDGRRVRLVVNGMRPLFVHELVAQGVCNEAGERLLHPEAYYTLNRIPSK